MFNRYKKDPETGLPALPNGEYWEVDFGHHVHLYLRDSEGNYVSAVRVMRWYDKNIYADDHDVTSRDIRVAANRIMREVRPTERKVKAEQRKRDKRKARDEARQQRREDNRAKFGGTYPPKKL